MTQLSDTVRGRVEPEGDVIAYQNGTVINLADISSVIAHREVPIRHTVVFSNGAVVDIRGCEQLSNKFITYMKEVMKLNKQPR